MRGSRNRAHQTLTPMSSSSDFKDTPKMGSQDFGNSQMVSFKADSECRSQSERDCLLDLKSPVTCILGPCSWGPICPYTDLCYL